MPRKKAPYFPFYPEEYLLDEKTESLELEEDGALLRLWSFMWINKVKRGHLFYNRKIPISDEQIAKKLRISPEKWQKIKEKFLKIGLLKIGKDGELFSKRLAKHKTKYELHKPETEVKRKRNGNEKTPNGSEKSSKRSKEKLREVKRSKEKRSKDNTNKKSSCSGNSKNQKPEFLERAEMLKFLILQNNPNAKVPDNLKDWANTVRLMVERDNRTLEDIDFVIGFSQKDDFWRRNILSMDSLRKQFDKLWMKGQPKDKHVGIKAWLEEQRRKYGQS